jgi:hypothetical protein
MNRLFTEKNNSFLHTDIIVKMCCSGIEQQTTENDRTVFFYENQKQSNRELSKCQCSATVFCKQECCKENIENIEFSMVEHYEWNNFFMIANIFLWYNDLLNVIQVSM